MQTPRSLKAIEFLHRTRNQDGGWPYIPGQPSAPEPSCYGNLVLGDAGRTTAWMDKENATRWTESLLLLTLRKLGLRSGMQVKLKQALLDAQVQQVATDKAVNDVDGQLRGWSWVDGTFSWVEPTSYALLALKSTGLLSHPRMEEAERLLLDRTCADGGWNYGNRFVRGAALTSLAPTTALATMALQRTAGAGPTVARAMDLLDREVSMHPSAMALSLTILCFDAFGRPSQHLSERLLVRQKPDGSWRGQPHLTSLALLAMQTGESVNVFKI